MRKIVIVNIPNTSKIFQRIIILPILISLIFDDVR